MTEDRNGTVVTDAVRELSSHAKEEAWVLLDRMGDALPNAVAHIEKWNVGVEWAVFSPRHWASVLAEMPADHFEQRDGALYLWGLRLYLDHHANRSFVVSESVGERGRMKVVLHDEDA